MRALASCALPLLFVSATVVGHADEPASAPPRTYSILARDGIAYLAQNGGLVTRDVSDPLRPKDLGWLPIPGTSHDLALEGQVALVAAGTRGLVVADVTDPRRPVELARLDTPGNVKAVVRAGRWAYLADGSNGLLVVDLEELAVPRIVARVSTQGELRALALAGQRLALAEAHGGARVFSLRDPDNPRDLRRLETPAAARDVCWIGERLFVALGAEGTGVYEPREGARARWTLPPVRSAQHVACGEERLAVANLGSALQLFDLSGAGAPRLAHELRVHRSSPIGRVRFEGERVWIAVDVAGMGLVDAGDPARPQRILPRRRTFRVTD